MKTFKKALHYESRNTPAPVPEDGADELQAEQIEDSDAETSLERSSVSSEELSKCVKKLIPSRPLLPQRQRRPERWVNKAVEHSVQTGMMKSGTSKSAKLAAGISKAKGKERSLNKQSVSSYAKTAVQEYHNQIARMTSLMLEHYHQMFGATFISGPNPLDPATREQRKAQFLGELNCSGKYFAFKEQMKNSVVRIVREHFMRTEPFTNPEELWSFLSQLYTFLVDEMHVALNKTLSAYVQEVPVKILLDCNRLTHFAKEAELYGEYQLADQYYQEQLARDQESPSPWFDYGMFCMQTEDYFKAEECFCHALAIDQTHLCSLLMCGILSEMHKRYEEAETFFKSATCVDPSCVVSWTLLGLYFFGQDSEKQAERALLEAKKQLRKDLATDTANKKENNQSSHKALLEDDTKPLSEPGKTEQRQVRWGLGLLRRVLHFQQIKVKETTTTPSTTIYLESAMFLVQMYAIEMAQRALSHEFLNPKRGPKSLYHLALGHMKLLRGEYSSAKENLQEVLSKDDQIPDAWALYGHLHYLMKDYEEARGCYEKSLKLDTECSDTHPVFVRLGSIYLWNGQYDRARRMYLHACMTCPSCRTWLGLGIACLRVGELAVAEDALTEANILNNKNPEVWGYLSLLCLKTGRKFEAEQSYKYAIKFNLKDEALLRELGELKSHFIF